MDETRRNPTFVGRGEQTGRPISVISQRYAVPDAG
jgi:hypothetical protein